MARWSTSRRRTYTGYGTEYGTVNIQWVPAANAYKLQFPFILQDNITKNFVELIKAKVPSNERSYDPQDNHAWYLTEPFYEAFLPIMKAMFTNCTFNIIDKAKVEEFNQGQAYSAVVSTDKLAEEFFQLLEQAGLQPNRETVEIVAVKRDYLRAARHYHPDINPAFAGEMSRLNELWSNLKGVYFK